MTEVPAGTAAPEVAPAPGANPVSAPAAPTGQENAPPQGDESVQPPKTFTEEDVRKTVNDRLTKERRRLERTVRAELRAEMAERRIQELEKPREQTTQPPGEPKQTDFDSYDEWILARAEYRIEQKLAKQREQTQQQSTQEREQRSAREVAEAVQARFAAAREKYEDFDDVVLAPDVPFTEPMAVFFRGSEIAGDLAYHLATNRDEAKRIAGLSPDGVFRALVKLESTLSAPPKPTQAPPPIVPSGGSAVVKKDWSDMSTKEHAEAYWKRNKR